MLNTSLQYSGDGKAEWGNPALQMNGPTVVTADERGKVTAMMQVADFPGVGSREEGVNLLLRESFSQHESSHTMQITGHLFVRGIRFWRADLPKRKP